MRFRATYKRANGEMDSREFEFGYDAQALVTDEAERLAGDGEALVGSPYRIVSQEQIDEATGRSR